MSSTLSVICPPSSVSSQSRCSRQRLRLAGALALDQVGQKKCQIDGLFGIEARIADRVVAVVEVLVRDLANAAGALRHVLAGHLQMDATRIGAFRVVHLEEGAHLLEYQVERPRLETGRRGDRIGMHGIARPNNRTTLTPNGTYHGRKLVAHLVGTEPADQGETARLVFRVE